MHPVSGTRARRYGEAGERGRVVDRPKTSDRAGDGPAIPPVASGRSVLEGYRGEWSTNVLGNAG